MNRYFAVILLSLECMSGAGLGHAAEPTPQEVEFFEKKIRPVLVEHCYQCHSQAAEKKKKLKGALYLDSSRGIHKGGETGPLFLPGKPAESLLIKALLHESDVRMPPTAKLPENVIADVRKWVSLGAPVPPDRAVEGEKKSIDWSEARQRWAFQLPVKHSPPKVKDERWPKADLDRFILAELERRGLKPVQAATKRDLIRRASFNLIGLRRHRRRFKHFSAMTVPKPSPRWSIACSLRLIMASAGAVTGSTWPATPMIRATRF